MTTNPPSIKKNYIYNMAYRLLTIITPVITAPYISRVLGPDNIGIYSFTNANVSYFILFGVFGLSSYSQLECAKRRDDKEAFSQFCVESILTRFLLMGISMSVYSYIFIFQDNYYKFYYELLLLSLLANLLDFTWICEGLEQYKTIALRNIVVKLLTVVSILLFVNEASDLDVYVFIVTFSVLLGNLIIIPYARKYVVIRGIKRPNIKPHLKASLAYFLPSIASTIVSTADKLMIGYFTCDMVQNGWYDQATKISGIILTAFTSLCTTMRPRMAYLYTIKDHIKAEHYFYKALSVSSFIAIPVCAGLIQVSDVFVPWFFGQGYDGVVVLLQIVAVWLLIRPFTNCLLELAIFCAGDISGITRIIWLGAFFNVLLNIILIPQLGALGAAIASLTAEIPMLLYAMKLSKIELKFNHMKFDMIKEFMAASIMFLIMFVPKLYFENETIEVLSMIILGTSTYIVIAIGLRIPIVMELTQGLKRKVGKSFE